MKLISFVARRPVVGTIERRPGERKELTVLSARPPASSSARIFVLIDSGTCNLAELAASAMRDAGGAVLIGSKTAGDDVLTRFTPLGTGGAVEIAAAHLYTASGKDLNLGVRPDYDVKTRESIRPDDPPIRRARKLLGV